MEENKMKKNNDVNVVFAEAEEILTKTMAEVNSERVNYKELLEDTNKNIARLQKESDEAYISGNILLGDQLTSEKNRLKERADSLQKINLTKVRNNLANKYSQDSSEFYKTVIMNLKSADEEDMKEVRELLTKLSEITNNAEVRRQKAMALLNTWNNSVVPFARGEQSLFITKLSRLNADLDRSQASKDIISGKTAVIIY